MNTKLSASLRLLGCAVIIGVCMGSCVSTARADGHITWTEQMYVDYVGPLICAAINHDPSPGMVLQMWNVLIVEGLPSDSAGDIVDASVTQLCPRHWLVVQRAASRAGGHLV